ncbi:MAG: hypothetical protein KIT22_15205 [Verrucomicrobiae bacterium]|nr:hypothetical protein [Verrucomicrobiae bacterium]
MDRLPFAPLGALVGISYLESSREESLSERGIDPTEFTVHFCSGREVAFEEGSRRKISIVVVHWRRKLHEPMGLATQFPHPARNTAQQPNLRNGAECCRFSDGKSASFRRIPHGRGAWFAFAQWNGAAR